MHISTNTLQILGLIGFLIIVLRIYFLFVSGSRKEEDVESSLDEVIARAKQLESDGMHNELQRYVQKELTLKYTANIELRKILAGSYYRTGNHKAAASHFDVILQLDPNDYDIKLMLAEALKLDKQTQRAIAAYKKILEINPEELVALKHISDLYLQMGQQEVALDYMEQYTDQEFDPEKINQANIKIAKLHFDLGNFEKAAQRYDALQQSYVDNTDLMFKRANIYLKLQEWQKCLDIYNNILQHKPDDMAVIEKVGQMKFNLGLWEEALELYKDIVDKEDPSSQNYIHHKNRIAEIYVNQGRSDMAIEILSDLIRRYPTEDLLAFTLAQAYISLGDFEKAVDLYTGLMENLPENQISVIQKHISEIIINWGSELINEGDYGNAFDKLFLAIKYDEANPDIYYKLGTANFHAKSFDDAIANFQRAISLAPQESDYYIALGYAYDEIGDSRAARNAFTDAININSDNIKAYSAMAMCLSKEQNYKTAIKNFKIVLEKIPDDPDANYNCALSYELGGDKDSAIYYYEKALEAAPGHVEARHNLALLTGGEE